MKLDLKGRINNINLPLSHSLWPLYETIINSLQAIEEKGNHNSGYIHIHTLRDDSNASLDLETDRSHIDIVGFEVEDNGIGFNENNFTAFNTSDTTYKLKKGGKGIGRFLWLKAFDNVNIKSTFLENGKIMKREFDFSFKHEGTSSDVKTESTKENVKTIVRLVGFKEKYQSACPKKVDTIGTKIITHFLSYFVFKPCPKIVLHDGDEEIDLKDFFEKNIKKHTSEDTFRIKNEEFKIIHAKLYASEEKKHCVYFCAIDREVECEKLNEKFPDLSEKIYDQENEFYYIGYVSGEYLNQRVNTERTAFNLLKGNEDTLYDETEVTEKELKENVFELIKKYLDDYLNPIRKDKVRRIENYIKTKSPRYRPLLKRQYLLEMIPPNLDEQKLEVELFKTQRKAEEQLIRETESLLKTKIDDIENYEEYEERRNIIIEKLNDFGKANLAEYIAHRKIMLDLLEKNLEADEYGKHKPEQAIHEIIFPLKKTSDDINYEQQNLWMIDERLAYHYYLASDKELSSLDPIDSASKVRPDLIIFNHPFAFVEGDSSYNSVVIIEFKKPCRNEYSKDEKDPIEQVYNYVDEIREGNVKNIKGRPFKVTKSTPFYCYVICDVTSKIRKFAKNRGLIPTLDDEGYYGFNPNHHTYIEVISYNKILNDAKKRNKILFEKLFGTDINLFKS